MPRDPRDIIGDIVEHIDFITSLTSGLTLGDYRGDAVRRRAVERSLEIVGEALRHLEHADPALLSGIRDASGMIGFRNVLAHRYYDVDDARVLEITRASLPAMRHQVLVVARDFP